jgi:hypothetical protein
LNGPKKIEVTKKEKARYIKSTRLKKVGSMTADNIIRSISSAAALPLKVISR